MSSNDQLADHTDLLEVVLLENPAKGIQYRFAITEFREVLYLSIREWYEGFEGDFLPTRNGFTIPYTLDTSAKLYNALTNILSDAEVLNDVIIEAQKYEHPPTDEGI